MTEALNVSVAAPESAAGYHVVHRHSGRLETARRSTLGFEGAGTIAAVAVDEGDVVNAGQLLARLDTQRLEAARRELLAERSRARSQRRLTEQTLERVREAVDYRGVSRQRLDEAQDAYDRARAALTLADARLASLDVDLAKSELRAPFAGTITRRLEDEGTVVAAGIPLLVLEETERLRARIGIAGSLAGSLAPGDTRQLMSNDGPLPASVVAVMPVRDPVARTVDVLLEVHQHRLSVERPIPRAGDLVTLEVKRFVPTQGYWLPIAALAESERGLWSVLVATPVAVDADPPPPGRSAGRREPPARVPSPATTEAIDGEFRIARRIVDVRHNAGDQVFVSGGIGNDDWLVVEGLHRIVVGQRVQPRPAGARVAEHPVVPPSQPLPGAPVTAEAP